MHVVSQKKYKNSQTQRSIYCIELKLKVNQDFIITEGI
jgi:hypothetical protein